MIYNFGPASLQEPFVFGSERPGYHSRFGIGQDDVLEWIDFMKSQGIERVCCLLNADQLDYYQDDLLDLYRQAFGAENVCHAPVPDFHLCDLQTLKGSILPFLAESAAGDQKVVVHCSGGMGRTGHVLAAWLVHGRGCSPEEAVEMVKINGVAREPREAVYGGHATENGLMSLLEACR